MGSSGLVVLAMLGVFGAHAAALQAPTLRIVDPPARRYVAHGVVPVPTSTDVATLAVPESDAEDLRVFAASPQWQLVEVAARVPAGTHSISLAPGTRDEPSPAHSYLRALTRRPPVRFVVEGHGGAREVVTLGTGTFVTRGSCRWVVSGTVHTQAFGTLRWFASSNDLDDRVWLTLRWTNAVHANGTARPEFLFRSAKLEPTFAGVHWASALPDPAIGDGYLVKPADHVFKQRGVRDFRVVLHRGFGAMAPDGWGCADWSGGGFLPAGYRVPKDIRDAAVELEQRASGELAAMAAGRPTGGTTDPASAPVSPLWPHAGVFYGGMGGEIDIRPCDGALTASTGLRIGLQMHRVLATRYGCRQLLVWEPDGTPVDPELHLINGAAQWDTFDFVFLRDSGGAPGSLRDAPWEFDQQPRPNGPRGYDPDQVLPVDWQHGIRGLKDALALAWLDADPAAIEYVVCMAELGRMTFWPGPGRARLVLPATPGVGWDVGRADFWVEHAVVAAAMFGRGGMRAHAQFYVAGFRRALMPSGLVSALRGGKVVDSPPLSGRFAAHRGNELSYYAGLLREYEAFGIVVSDLIEGAARGTRELAWSPGTGRYYDRHPLGPIDGGPMYRTRADAPPDAWAGMEQWSYGSGYLTGSLGTRDLYDEWRGEQSLAGLVIFRDSPLEVFLPALSRWSGN